MTVRSYLWGMRISTLIALTCLGLVIYHVDPYRDGLMGQMFFYVSIFFSITGLATLFLFWLRRNFSKGKPDYENVGMNFRQGMLIALVVSGLLVLQSYRLLVWWDAGIVIAGALLIELWFLSK